MERGPSRMALPRSTSDDPRAQKARSMMFEDPGAPPAAAIVSGEVGARQTSAIVSGEPEARAAAVIACREPGRHPAAAVAWALLLALVLALGMGSGPAGAQDAGGQVGNAAPSPRGIGGVCPPPEAAAVGEPDGFGDLETVHTDAITCAASYGLVSGYGDGTYRPGRLVTRGQMATFVRAWIEAATDITLEAPEETRFGDAEDSVHRDAIEALAEVRIIGGRADGSFAPGEPLTRGQFARAVVNAISYADVFEVDGPLPPAATDESLIFDDIAGTTFEKSITALATSGITVGRDGSFNPDERVTRGQLATFLMRGADYLHEYQRWQPTAEVHAYVADLSSIGEGSDGTDGVVQPSGKGRFWIDAFDGSLVYQLDLSGIPGPFGPEGGAAIHLGQDGDVGQEVIRLADGATLDAKVAEARAELGSLVVGVVPEKDSRLRFAELLAQPEQLYVLVSSSAEPDGVARGQLTRVN